MENNKSYPIHIKVYDGIDDKTASYLFYCYMMNGRDSKYTQTVSYTLDNQEYIVGAREYRKSLCVYIHKNK